MQSGRRARLKPNRFGEQKPHITIAYGPENKELPTAPESSFVSKQLRLANREKAHGVCWKKQKRSQLQYAKELEGATWPALIRVRYSSIS